MATIEQTSTITLKEIAMLTRKRLDLKPIKKEPAKRGEHVFNNNLLKLFKSIVEGFISIQYVEKKLYYDSLIKKAKGKFPVFETCELPMDRKLMKLVSEELVAHMQDAKKIPDTNAEAYGIKIQELRCQVIILMQILHVTMFVDSSVKSDIPKQERVVDLLVEEIIGHGYYVDIAAKEYWVKHQKGSRKVFEEVNEDVERLVRRLSRHYNDGEVTQWVREIQKASLL